MNPLISSLLATLVPHASTPEETAPSGFDVLRGVWTALISSGALLTLLTQVEPLARQIPHPVASAVVAGLVHLAVILVRQYATGPVSYR